jgi:hypothetical protein
MRSQPEKSLIIFQNCLNNVTGQAVFRCENGKGTSASIEQVEAAPGTNPETFPPVLPDGGDIVMAQAARVLRVIGIWSKAPGLRVKPVQPGLRPQPKKPAWSSNIAFMLSTRLR